MSTIENYNQDLQKSKNDISHNEVLEKTIILSEQQKKEIQNSQKEYLEGNYFDNDSGQTHQFVFLPRISLICTNSLSFLN